jgi:protein-S-isoprenylcysteine O-methyltransferase Ste14
MKRATALAPRARFRGTGAMDLDVDLGLLPRPAPPAAAPVASRDLGDLIGRAIIIVLFTMMAVRLGQDYVDTGRLTGLLLLASEALVVVLTLFRRAPAIVDRSMEARVLTALSLMGSPLVQPATVPALAPEAATIAISAVGLLVVIAGKLSLGRSFGLMPANRGIVSTGLYRLVRHPIYMGYLVTHIAFLAANPIPWNFVMLLSADAALLARAVCEERTLGRDEAYRAYQQLVRWRVLPGVF